jgi:hypothetical protein
MLRPFYLLLISLLLACSGAKASLIYLYDFPGDPGSGLATDQTNPQPSNVTFSDFSRTNLTLAATSTPGEFDTSGFAHNGQDTTQYQGFSITAAAGHVLSLTSLTFDAFQYASGATQGQVALFLNGSAVAYATQGFHWDVNGQVTFDFIDLTDGDNITSAEFRFYGWTAGSINGADGLDNVAINGTIGTAVPEASAFWPIMLLMACVGMTSVRETRRRCRVLPGKRQD